MMFAVSRKRDFGKSRAGDCEEQSVTPPLPDASPPEPVKKPKTTTTQLGLEVRTREAIVPTMTDDPGLPVIILPKLTTVPKIQEPSVPNGVDFLLKLSVPRLVPCSWRSVGSPRYTNVEGIVLVDLVMPDKNYRVDTPRGRCEAELYRVVFPALGRHFAKLGLVTDDDVMVGPNTTLVERHAAKCLKVLERGVFNAVWSYKSVSTFSRSRFTSTIATLIFKGGIEASLLCPRYSVVCVCLYPYLYLTPGV